MHFDGTTPCIILERIIVISKVLRFTFIWRIGLRFTVLIQAAEECYWLVSGPITLCHECVHGPMDTTYLLNRFFISAVSFLVQGLII